MDTVLHLISTRTATWSREQMDRGDFWLRMLGYNSDHLELKQKMTEDRKGQLVGNTFPVVVVARLLCGLASQREKPLQ